MGTGNHIFCTTSWELESNMVGEDHKTMPFNLGLESRRCIATANQYYRHILFVVQSQPECVDTDWDWGHEPSLTSF